MGVWASTEVDRIDLKRDVEEVSLGMTRYSSHYLPIEEKKKRQHEEIINANKCSKRCNSRPSTMQKQKNGTRVNTITCCLIKKLYHATDNTANQDTGKPLYIRRYYIQTSPRVCGIDCVDRCIKYGMVY